MTDLKEQPEPQSSGCLTALVSLVAVVTVLMIVFLASCAIIGNVLFPDTPIETISRTEILSPNGEYMAVLYQREQSVFLDRAFWTDLAISKGPQKEALIGSMGRTRPDVRWMDEHKLLVTLHARPSLQAEARAFDMKIIYHLSDNLHVGAYLQDLQLQESGYANSGSREGCRTIYRNWSDARDFYRWSNLNADNGDPDPGSWVSKVLPTDCSTLPKP